MRVAGGAVYQFLAGADVRGRGPGGLPDGAKPRMRRGAWGAGADGASARTRDGASA